MEQFYLFSFKNVVKWSTIVGVICVEVGIQRPKGLQVLFLYKL